tara:strand:- start:1823 stop:2923 length:1101 start_codon:yes stop_codon:yes gene_type:complete
MASIEVIAGISVPYKQDEETKKWSGTVGHSWTVDNSYVIEFAKEADRKIRRRSKNHGKITYPPKPRSLADSLQDHLNVTKNIDFNNFVNNVQKTNSIILKTSRVRAQLVLIFLKYRKEHENSTNDSPSFFENLLVVLLKDKSALRFGDDGEPQGTDIIDFDDVMQAAIINIDEFQQSIEKNDDLDVSFINGVGGTTDYFIEFFDAEGVIKNKESVSNVLKALEDFAINKKLSRAQRELCASKVKAKIDFNERNKLATKLQDISSVVYDALKVDPKLEVKRDSFEGFIQEYNYKVNEEFTVSKKERDALEFISLETDVGDLKLKKSFFSSKGKQGNIIFNHNTEELTIKTKIKDKAIVEILKKLQDD